MVGAAFTRYGDNGPGFALAVRRMAASGSVSSGRPEHELRREMWQALALENVRRWTYVLEVAAHVRNLRGEADAMWVPRVRSLWVAKTGTGGAAQVVRPFDTAAGRALALQR